MQDISTFIFNHLYLSYAFAIVLVLLLIVETIRQKRGNSQVDVTQAVQLINRHNAAVIDIRGSDSFQAGHIIDAQSMTASDLTGTSKKVEKFKGKPIIIVCASGTESQKIAALLKKQGYNAHSISGGIRAWVEAEMPLIKG